MENQMELVNKAKMSKSMTCPLCNNFSTDVVTISDCSHTFCRQCISKKLTDENLKHCPVCNMDLGCNPLQKLREEIATKQVISLQESVFPSSKLDKEANVEKGQRCSTIQILEKIKQNLSRRRAKTSRKINIFLRESISTHQPDNEAGNENREENYPQLQTFNMTSKTIFQNFSKSESSQDRLPKEISNATAKLWKPLIMLHDAAKLNLPMKPAIQEHDVIPILLNLRENDSYSTKGDTKNSSYQTKTILAQKATPLESKAITPRRSKRIQEKTPTIVRM